MSLPAKSMRTGPVTCLSEVTLMRPYNAIGLIACFFCFYLSMRFFAPVYVSDLIHPLLPSISLLSFEAPDGTAPSNGLPRDPEGSTSRQRTYWI